MLKGIMRPIDSLGRVVIPKELRKAYGLDEHYDVEIYPDGQDKITLHIITPCCAICNSKEGLERIRDKYICPVCKDLITDIHNDTD